MGIPEVIEPRYPGDYLNVMTRAVFQAGVTWSQIEAKWDAYTRAFADWDAEAVANFDEADIERLMAEPGVMHSRKKIVATIKNAQKIIQLDKEHKGFQNYLRSRKSYEELEKDLRKQFKFLGQLSVYYFLFRVGEEVPDFDEWIKTIEGHHPRMREMVEAHRGRTV